MENPEIKVTMLGSFEIAVDGKTVLEKLNQTSKTRMFLEYLILKNCQPVTQTEIVDALWDKNKSTNPTTALRTLLHRFRTLVERSGIDELDNMILTIRGAYRINPSLNLRVDAFEFEKLAVKVNGEELPENEKVELYEQIMDIYKGQLLPKSAQEMWVVSKSVYYHDLYMTAVLGYIELLKKREDYERVVAVCRRALEVDMYDERLHLELMLALTKTGKTREALAQYSLAIDIHHKVLDTEPSQQLRDLYGIIVQRNRDMGSDIDDIERSMEEADSSGAFVCEYAIFKDIYQLQKRIVERYSSTMFIALMSVSPSPGNDAQAIEMDEMSDMLFSVARNHLRKGDTLSRYSASQFVMLLPAVNYDMCASVMERIRNTFYGMCENNVRVNYKIKALAIKRPEE